MTLPLRLYLLMRILILLVQIIPVTSNHLILVKPQGRIINLITTALFITTALSLILILVAF